MSVEQYNIDDLKKELTKMIGSGEDIYSISLFGITTHFLLNAKKTMDFAFFEYLEEVSPEVISDPSSEDEEGSFLEVATLYYLLAKNNKGFKKSVNWLPEISAGQKKKIMDWPKNYILSIFELKDKNDEVFYKDVRDGKEYSMGFYASEIGLEKVNTDKLTIVSLIVPTDERYLATPPVFYPLNDLAFAKLKKTKDKADYEYAVLKESSDYLTNLYDDDDFDMDEFELDFDELHPFYPADRTLGESDKGFAKRLLEQSKFFEDFEYYNQAEKFMIKVIQTFPQLFHSDANAHELLEALRLIFVDEQFDADDLRMLSDEVPIFWFTLIKKHLSQEVAALEPYIVPDGFDDDELPF